ncbi:MAG: hypothetical protein ACI4PU_04220 [Intestinibacter sp.]
MLQILNWLCLISICFLSIQVFCYMCKNAINIFYDITKVKKVSAQNTVKSSFTEELINKIAK